MFDKIAKDWERKRRHPWEPFTQLFEKSWSRWLTNINSPESNKIEPKACIFIDLGCGSGRHFDYFQQKCNKLICLDNSREMLKLLPLNSQKVQADLAHLPFRDESAHGLFAVASLHHIKGESARERAIHEIKRVGDKRALVAITVWRFYQKRFLSEFRTQLGQCNKTEKKEIGDVIIPWTLSQNGGQTVIDRFYHLFSVGEFYRLMIPFTKLYRGTMGARDKKDNFIFLGTKK